MVCCAALLVGAAAPAAAHTRAKTASGFDSRIVEAPAIDGVSWRVYTSGDYLEVTNTSGVEVTVAGYDGEPYLRVGPGGVHENRNSPATYLNMDRYGDVAVPPRTDAAAPPRWVRISESSSHAWHDHRVHWMAEQPPPAVTADRATRRHILDWTVPFTHGGEQHELRGTLHWVPDVSWLPWAAAGLLLSAPALAGLLRRSSNPPDILRPAAVTVAAVAAVNALHLVDELTWPTPALDVLFGLLHTILFVGTGIAGAVMAWRGRSGPVLSLGIASGAVLFHQGLLQLRLVTASQLPSVFPPPVLRLAVALSVAQALWTTVVIVAAMRAASPRRGQSSEALALPATPEPLSAAQGLRLNRTR